MSERVKLINPECTVNIIDDFISPENQSDYLNRGYDYVIDAIDNVKTKASLIAYCKRNKINVITIGGAGGQTDQPKFKLPISVKPFKIRCSPKCGQFYARITILAKIQSVNLVSMRYFQHNL